MAAAVGRDVGLKLAVLATPLGLPAVLYLGRGLEDRAFLSELDGWCRAQKPVRGFVGEFVRPRL
eukprot:SAG31_NODE_37304_length_305_cov_1.000000_2_plen_63_part_01